MTINTQLLQDNLELVAERDEKMMSTFYGLLFTRYPAAKALFGRNSQNDQEKMLGDALMMLVESLDEPAVIEEKMIAVGRKHVDYEVEDHMYAWVKDCLMETFRRASASDWSAELEENWSTVLDAVATIGIRGAAIERAERASAQPSAPPQ